MGLSKSRFIAGLQCLKRLYLEVHQPELAGELDDQSMAVCEQGYEVGRWAQKVFPGGVLVEAGSDEMGKALRQTEQAVADKDIQPYSRRLSRTTTSWRELTSWKDCPGISGASLR